MQPHVIDQIEAYIAGGLSPEERAAFDRHIAGCADCAQALKETAQMDAAMNQLFALSRPAGGFEERLIQGLRNAGRRRRWVHPMVRRVATGVAAAVLLASVGYVGNAAMNGAPLPRWASSIQGRLAASTNLRQAGLAQLFHPNAEMVGASMNFHDAPVKDVLDYYAKKFGYRIDPETNVSGRVTITSDRPVGEQEATIMLNAALKPNNLTAVRAGGDLRVLRVISRGDAPTANLPVKLVEPGSTHLPASDDMITAVIPVKNGAAQQLRGELSANSAGSVVSNHGANTLIVTDSSSKVQQFADAIATNNEWGRRLGEFRDQEQSVDSYSSRFKRGDEGKLGVIAGKPAAQPAQDFGRIADVNRAQRDAAITDLSVNAPAATPPVTWSFDTDKKMADASYYKAEPSGGPTEMRVFQLQKADADQAAKLMQGTFSTANGNIAAGSFGRGGFGGGGFGGSAGGRGRGFLGANIGGGGGAGASVQSNTSPVNAVADEKTNTLVVTAPRDQMKAVEGLVNKLESDLSATESAISNGNSPTGRTSSSSLAGRTSTLGDKNKDVAEQEKKDGVVQQQAGEVPKQAAKPVDEIIAGSKLDQNAPAQTPPPATPPSDATPTNTQPAVDGRKIIRNGDMEFEVDSFDSAVMQISKIAAEEGGFVSTTESDKLPNGKVKGRVVLRVPPQRLDTLVLKLRGIGDLRTQRIGAQDVTKQYTDTESALRAAKAMQERLLDIIKNGKGAVKDLLEAEKQLGVWREKIEQLEGEIRYYNNLISLSTLSVTLMERDIKNPAFASETETVAMSLETEKVEDDYQKARDAIAEAKGRITASELKQFDAGQYRATISALLPPDAAEAVIARVRQLDGRLAHFERQRSQSTSNGEASRVDPVRMKREDVVLNLTIYNLANIAPRRTTTLLIVAPNVEEAYRNLIEQVNSSGGRVITSTIARPKPDQTAGNINFNVPADKADIILAALRGSGEVLKTDTSESPDTQNVTESKRGFSVTISSLSAFAARETQQVQLAAPAVSDAFNEVLNAVRGKDGRVINSQLNEQDPQNVTGTIDFEAPRDSLGAIDQAFRHSSEIVSRIVTRSTDTENTVDTKVHFTLTVTSADRLPARESLAAQLAATNVIDAYTAIRAAVPKGGHVLTSELNEQDPQNVSAHLVFDLPQAAEPAMQELLKKNTAVLSRQVHRVPEGQVAVDKLRVELTLVAADRQPPRQIVHLGVQVADVEKASDDLVAAATSAGGRQSDNPSVTQDQSGHTSATITVDVPADKLQTLLDQIDHMGNRRTRQVGLNTQVPETRLSRAQVQVTFSDSAANLGGQESMGDYVRNGLLTSLKGLGYSLMWIIIGVCLIAPWALLIWGAWRLAKRSRGARTAPTA